ncbi:alpha/beta fold hydrolase [Anaerobacillus sp. CMMVII]|uniref:esterase/lipase family protein n=1 Tax=Anaerobacillus sp. CMMVII TaxID=2755588 RepID=UPI0021B7A563|nr:alpha/beta fold hydrolase [Anaerobacillus sp. CMMVII]MCT8138514.1 alpha/beta fold hydrolase [Anaerobacillus sp. CMMVII]
MKKRSLGFTFAIVLVFALIFQSVGLANSLFHKTEGEPFEPGTFHIGTLPAEPDPNKPVLVFVQGLTNNSTTWYQGNNMYDLARQEGFETAFVELHDSGGTPKSYWDNGAILADQLEQISDYFNGKKLVVVGYSKGGVDAQVALIHEGKHHLVSDVVTIGSPHWGSELADLANSSSLGWLAALIGQNSEGTQSLQTGVMNYFRSITDSRWEVQQNRYYTIAGNRAGPLFSNYWFGGGFIPGASDGVVSVASAHLPYGEMLRIGNWNHGEVHRGSNALPLFKDRISTTKPMEMAAFDNFYNKTGASALDILVRGGSQNGLAEETFYVESDVKKLSINWMSATELTSVEVVRPGNNEKKVYDVVGIQDTEYFNGAWHHYIEIEHPKKGEWTIRTHTDEKSAYAMLVKFDSELNKRLSFVEDGNKNNWRFNTDFEAGNSKGNTPFKLFYDIDFVPGKGNANKQIGHKMRNFRQNQNHENNLVTIPNRGEGAYNITVNIEGVTPTGDKFQRTVIKSVYIDDQGNAY